jgi:FKBP-type peptidyl-prolyl cis-trans isomerase
MIMLNNFLRKTFFTNSCKYFFGIAVLICICQTVLHASPKYKTTKTGLKYQITKKVKKGNAPIPFHTVQILFNAKLTDGTVIASSTDREKPMEFIYQNNEVLKGWDEAISLMKIGEKGIFILPPQLAYGDKKVGKIPANSTITMEIELIGAYQTFYTSNTLNCLATNSGLKYLIINKKRSSEAIVKGNYVLIHYTGYLIDPSGKRTVFDSSKKNKSGSLVQCGAKKFINGLDEGILLANVGDSITLIIPPNLGYGTKTNQLVPANSTIGFDVYIEKQINPFFDGNPIMNQEKGFQYGYFDKKALQNAKMNDNIKVNLLGYYILQDGTPYIFESSFEKKEAQNFRIGRALENPAWLYTLQQVGIGDKVKLVMEPDMARTELKKLIPENVSVFFEFEVLDISPSSFLNIDNIKAIDLGDSLKLFMFKEGNDISIDSGDIAYIHYTGFTTDSLGNKKVFDSSFDRGTAFEVVVGSGKVIKGWDMGLIGRKEEDQFRLEIPPVLAYGKRGVPPLILQDEILYFDMYIVKIIKKK